MYTYHFDLFGAGNPMRFPKRTLLLLVLGVTTALGGLVGCQKAAVAPAAPASATTTGASADAADQGKDKDKDKDADISVSLSAEDATKLGVKSEALKTATWVPESGGYGLVVSHDGIAQALAELRSAQAATHQSRAALARIGQLSGGAGALSADVREAAERQSGIDAAALALAERRLSTVVGEHPTWPASSNDATLASLASGGAKLVRVTFLAGVVLPGKLASLRLTRVGAEAGEKSWPTRAPWPAPTDPAVPGRSFFALLSGSDLGEGEHVEAWAPVGPAERGLLVPSSALVQSAGKYWCYLESAVGKYQRMEVDTRRPLADGYVVTDGLSAGQHVVTEAAALLLARELNPSTEAG
jgi:hypothetical protein